MAAGKKFEQADSMTLTDLEQIRVLADPLRIQIMEVLCDGEHTTKQVADKLGEKPTKLYHHVEALEKIGLIRQTRTRRNRGTLERYYLGVARTFRADSGVFLSEEAVHPAGTFRDLVHTVLERTGQELLELAAVETELKESAEKILLSFIELNADAKTIDRLTKRIHRLLKDIEAEALEGAGADTDDAERRFRLTLAFYPLDRSKG